MDLVRPGLAALGAWIGASILAAIVMTLWSTTGQLQAMSGKISWVLIPQLLVGGLAAMAASYTHRRPHRDEPGRHAIAVLGPVGVLMIVQALANLAMDTYLWSTGLAFLAEAAGGVVGWLLVSRVVRRREHEESAAARRYF